MNETWGLAVLLFLAAILYTSVGHAGASGYLAAMALYDLAPTEMRPAALLLNLIAATLGTSRFRSAGHFDRRLFMLLAVTSIPAAYVGGVLKLPDQIYKPILASALLFAAVRLIWSARSSQTATHQIPVWAGLVTGAGIGLLSGLTGVGGGIYLTPVLLFMGWAETKTAAGVSAAFILVNSAAGLLGRLTVILTHPEESHSLPDAMPIWAVIVALGGLIGSTLGSRVFGAITLRRVLAIVLIVAASKLLFG